MHQSTEGKIMKQWNCEISLMNCCHCAGIDGGNDVDTDLLTGIYERVGDCEFKPGSDHVSQVMRIEQMIVGKKPVCESLVVAMMSYLSS